MLRLTIAVASAIAVSHPAMADPIRHSGEDEGHRFEYGTELRDNGHILIKGEMVESRESFRLDVAPNGWVQGRFGNWSVSYRVDKVLRDRVAAELGEKPVALAEASAPSPR